MPDEEHAKQIIDFALIPVRSVVEARYGGHGSGFVGVGLHSDPRVVPHGEHVVDDLEPLVFGGIVDGRNVGDHGEFSGGMVFEEGEDGKDAGRGNVDC